MRNKTKMQIIKHLKTYLDHIDDCSKSLSPFQRKKLAAILSSILTLLVCLKKASDLGVVVPGWVGRWRQ